MDHPPNGDSFPSFSMSGSQRQARNRPRDSDDESPSQGPSETAPRRRTLLWWPMPGAKVDSATTSSSGVASSPEEAPTEWAELPFILMTRFANAECWRRKSPGRDQEEAGPLSLSAMESLSGPFTDEALDFRLPCTATEDTTCQIVGHLSAWNEFLFLVSLQLRDMPANGGRPSLGLLCTSIDSFCTLQELRLVALLVRHLLKTHRCVAHVDLDVVVFHAHQEILSEALRGSPSITSVKLTCSLITGGLATAVLSLPHLQELECVGDMQTSATLIPKLCTLLQTTRSLETLRISEPCPEGLRSADLFSGLAQNCSLQELVLPGHLIARAPPSAQAEFTEWLKNSTSLKRLTVTNKEGRIWSLKGILRGLLGNGSITSVDFERPKLEPADVHLLSKVFEQNRVLRSFTISYELGYYTTASYFVEGRPDKADRDRCLKALVENQSLEEVALPIDVWDEDQWKELFEALPAKRNLKRVSIKAVHRASGRFVDKLCAALKKAGADKKVSFNASLSVEEHPEGFECEAFSSVLVPARDENGAALERMLSLGHITCLHLDFRFGYNVGRVLFSALATFLATNRTLKTLTLSTSLPALLCACKEALIDGLAANTSLREVQIDQFGIDRNISEFFEPLADVINASKNISRLHLGRIRYKECALLERLAGGIADNYTLLDFTMQNCLGNTPLRRAWFEVTYATRRNQGLLTCAADFATNARRDRRCALALERMQGHPELVEKVAMLEGVEQARAATMVQDSLRCIEGLQQFMRLAGVVRERVACRASKDGRTQLDALNEHCWRAIRRYLKLRDIRDPTTGALPPQ